MAVPVFSDGAVLPSAVQCVGHRYGDHQLLEVLERMADAGIACPIAEPPGD
jgi:Asp-tRNA(Asn)/Glu-tRNA(Gln) amidotransferase A subunit family amidase